MWPNTKLTKLLNIQLPIIQAPMAGGPTTPELVAAVSNAGGLGSLGAGYLDPEEIRKIIIKIKSLTDKPFAVNLFIPEPHHATKQQMQLMIKTLKKLYPKFAREINPVFAPFVFPFAEQLQVIIAEKVPVFSFTFGIPAAQWIKKLKLAKIKLMGTATNLPEALALQKAGIDVIAAQGCEAGGHRGTFLGRAEEALIGSFALIPQIADHTKVPIVASGGIMDARGILAALILGATGVQMGTAFLACTESGAHAKFKKTILQNKQDNTVLTRAYSGRLVRAIKNKFTTAMEAYQKQILDYPIQNSLTRSLRAAAAKKGLTDIMSMYSGQAAYLSQDLPAAELLRRLDEGVKRLMR